MTNIHWEDPPKRRRGERFFDLADELRQHPGKWARFDASEYSETYAVVTNIRQGRLAAFTPPGAFEATQQRQPDRTRKVWIRYVGERGEYADE